jgi:hypothetical protein
MSGAAVLLALAIGGTGGELELRIALEELRSAWIADRSVVLQATFRNLGERPIAIVSPDAAAFWDAEYRVVVRDLSDGKSRPLGRCRGVGSAEAHRATDQLALLEPGASIDVPCPAAQDLPPGRYAVRLTYVMRARPDGELPSEADRLARGAVESNELVLDLEGSTIDRWLRAPAADAVAHVLESLGDPKSEEALLDALRTLVESDRLGESDRARVRAAVLAELHDGAGSRAPDVAMRVLYLLADESCAPTFEQWMTRRVLLAGPVEFAALGLRKLRGRAVVVPLVAEMRTLEGEAAVPALHALEVIVRTPDDVSGKSASDLVDDKSVLFAAPTEIAACKARWLAWWRDEGEAWVRAEKPR